MKMQFATRDIATIAIFLALLFVVDMMWVVPVPLIIGWPYGIAFVSVLIVAAFTIKKRYAILTIGFLYAVMNLFLAHMWGGTLLAFAYLTGAIALEFALLFSAPYASNAKIDAIGGALYGFVDRTTGYALWIFVYGLNFPSWYALADITSFTVACTIGGYLGHRLGKRIKPVISGTDSEKPELKLDNSSH